MLRQGGNAIDAAVAANAVLCVVYPHMTSIGGDLFALVWPAGDVEPVGLEGAGRSGAGATVEAMRERGFERMPERGATTVTVPGTVQAWGRLIERYGTVGLGRALAPAAAGPVTRPMPTVPNRSSSRPHAWTVPGTVTVVAPCAGIALKPRSRMASMEAPSPDRPEPCRATGADAPAGQTSA